ncbi:MAG: ATP-dependent DNA helicase, partial [Nanoarchaeota archaeon]|nr:ATP-dependent DNA helicase [Nanoarchaeota archaeon]
KEVAERAHSVIFMSGTLTPTFMYKDILGFEKAIEKEFDSPFPESNKLSLIIPQTTTKYTRRNDAEYKKMATIIAGITDEVPGNSAVFFPSYYLRDQVYRFFHDIGGKTVLLENQGMTKSEKGEFLEKFKSYKKNGAVLLAVAAGSFGEGIDLPGDYLKCVVIVGLPLEKPNLEMQELIKYYDGKFSKGWDYGYIFPAIQKVLQNAGRCIRSETDRGVIVFLDERWAWPSYRRCIPKEYNVKVSTDFLDEIKKFYG